MVFQLIIGVNLLKNPFVLAHIKDAFRLMAISVNQTVNAGQDYNSGAKIVQNAKFASFSGKFLGILF